MVPPDDDPRSASPDPRIPGVVPYMGCPHPADQARINHDHESRIRALEGRQWPLPSLAVVVSILAMLAAILVSIAMR